jgi:hypothetical protein
LDTAHSKPNKQGIVTYAFDQFTTTKGSKTAHEDEVKQDIVKPDEHEAGKCFRSSSSKCIMPNMMRDVGPADKLEDLAPTEASVEEMESEDEPDLSGPAGSVLMKRPAALTTAVGTPQPAASTPAAGTPPATLASAPAADTPTRAAKKRSSLISRWVTRLVSASQEAHAMLSRFGKHDRSRRDYMAGLCEEIRAAIEEGLSLPDDDVDRWVEKVAAQSTRLHKALRQGRALLE